MSEHRLNAASLARWRADPAAFIEHVLIDPATGKPFELLPADEAFLAHAFQLGDNGRLLYPEMLYSCPKKSGKTTFAAIIMLSVVLLYGGRFAEGYALANDQEQAQSRVFAIAKRIVEASPLLRSEAETTQQRISFPALHST